MFCLTKPKLPKNINRSLKLKKVILHLVIAKSRDGKVKIEWNYDKINVVRGLVLFIPRPYTNS